ncbi:RNA methyltransferase [Candidatus Peregrinibacteria bacterium CG_4_9_14_0_2_um_filter_53_11]|nr:MAG: RNA methyltransferase [Candidatus Peregrinibacteria bacterium CG_4_9_14_0_2_um_filter_53_11]
MSYDEHLADRIGRLLDGKHVLFEEKKMMGGLCFMVKEKMCLGVIDDKLMARIDPEIYEDSLKRKGCHEMNFTGRPMKGFVFVEAEGVDADEELSYWVGLCLDYNPKAKKSKRR